MLYLHESAGKENSIDLWPEAQRHMLQSTAPPSLPFSAQSEGLAVAESSFTLCEDVSL